MKPIRMDKYLTMSCLGSRKDVKMMMNRSRVRVNGEVVKTGDTKVNPGVDIVTLDNQPVPFREHLYIMMNKPVSVLSATRDRQITVVDILPEEVSHREPAPVGRLDRDTTGLILITTHGEIAHGMLSPKRHVSKCYRALLDGPVGAEDTQAFAKPMDLGDFISLPALLEPEGPTEGGFVARVTLVEGKFHQVKRMFAARGRRVIELHRETFGPLVLDSGLEPGEWRYLTPEEEKAVILAGSKQAEDEASEPSDEE